jgi:tellurite resistance protein TerC
MLTPVFSTIQGLFLGPLLGAMDQGVLSTVEWTTFAVVVAVMLAIDIFVHRGEHADSRSRAIMWTVIWVAAGLAFNVYVWWIHPSERAAEEYLASYLIEKALSLDNLFVFLIIFKTLRIPAAHQRKALSWGIFGALLFRAIFIFLGAEALEKWHWVEYVFALLLLYAAWHAYREDPAQEEESKLAEWLSHRLPVSRHTKEAHFFTRENGKLRVTPLLVAVIGLELTDVMFAIDSVPAAFSITTDRFIIYSSNVFAILGLRSLYIAMAATLGQLRYLHYGLAAVLAFAAAKMLIPETILPITPLQSVGIIVGCIGLSIWASVRWGKPEIEELPANRNVQAIVEETDNGHGAQPGEPSAKVGDRSES